MNKKPRVREARAQESPGKDARVKACVNEVTLIGRLGSTVTERDLPSGDIVTAFSIVVDRPLRDRRGSVTVDAIPCHTFSSSIGARVMSWEPGLWIQVGGMLRRRFWRSGSATSSLLDVQATTVRRLGR
jgi:single-strand DNA-binding protein